MSRRATTDEERATRFIMWATEDQLDTLIRMAMLAKEIRFGASVEPKRTRGPAKKHADPVEYTSHAGGKTE